MDGMLSGAEIHVLCILPLWFLSLSITYGRSLVSVSTQHTDFLRAFIYFSSLFFLVGPIVYVRVRITPTILSTRIVKIKIQALLCRIRTHSHTLHLPSFSSPAKKKKNVAKRGNLPELKQIEKVCHNHNAKVKSF